MRTRKVEGWYVVNAAGEQVAWHKTRAGARKIALRMSNEVGGVYYTQPEYAEAA